MAKDNGFLALAALAALAMAAAGSFSRVVKETFVTPAGFVPAEVKATPGQGIFTPPAPVVVSLPPGVSDPVYMHVYDAKNNDLAAKEAQRQAAAIVNAGKTAYTIDGQGYSDSDYMALTRNLQMQADYEARAREQSYEAAAAIVDVGQSAYTAPGTMSDSDYYLLTQMLAGAGL